MPVAMHLEGSGDIDYGIESSARGFLIPRVKLLDEVSAGQELGVLSNLQGELVERYHAQAAGVIALVRAVPVVEPGDMLFHITGLLRRAGL